MVVPILYSTGLAVPLIGYKYNILSSVKNTILFFASAIKIVVARFSILTPSEN
jgi:hypothetical protein